MPDLSAYARAVASSHGLDSDRFERQIEQESGFNPGAYNVGSGASGIAQIIPRWHPGVDVWDPEVSLVYAAGLMRSHRDYWLSRGYPEQAALGLALSSYNAGLQATIDGLAGTKPGWPFAETIGYLSIILQIPAFDAHKILTGGASPKVTYNPQEPVVAQNDPWSCAPTSTRWAMKALGRNPTEAWMETQMKADGIVSEAQGLLDASGAGLAAWIRAQYGEFGYTASHTPSVSFDDVVAESGRYPLLLGGRTWNHWSGVRGAAGDILLANPSEGWKGVGQRMTREQFNALGPFSMVRITHPDVTTPVPQDPKDKRIAELEASVASLRSQLDEERTKLGVLQAHYLPDLQNVVRAIGDLKPGG